MLEFALLFSITYVSMFIFCEMSSRYLSHRRMSKRESENRPIGKGNYKDFKNRFELIKNWEYDSQHENSLFLFNRDSRGCDGIYKIVYIHASIIIFNENTMLLGPIDYFRARILIRQKIKELKTPNKNKKIKSWNEIESEEILNKISNN